MAFTEAQATKPFQDEINKLGQYTQPIENLTGAGQLQQDKLQESRFSEMKRAKDSIKSDINTGKSMSELTGDRGYVSDIMDRSQDSLNAGADRAVSSSFSRMADASRSNDFNYQDARGFDASKKKAILESSKADAQNKLRISEYQAKAQEEANSGGLGKIIGGTLGAIGGVFIGNPALGYAAGSAIGGYAETL